MMWLLAVTPEENDDSMNTNDETQEDTKTGVPDSVNGQLQQGYYSTWAP